MSYFKIEYLKKEVPMMTYFHCHDYYELFFLLDGTRNFFKDTFFYQLRPQALAVSKPYEMHKFQGDAYSRILIHVSKDWLSRGQIQFLDDLAEKGVLIFNEEKFGMICNVLKKMLDSFQKAGEEKAKQFALYFGYVLFCVDKYGKVFEEKFTFEKRHVSKTSEPIVFRVVEYLNEHYAEKISLQEIVKKLNISKAWLSYCFREAMGCTITDYKLFLQLMKAKTLLASTDMSYKAIAKETGFSSVDYFRYVFSKNTGITPKKYRDIALQSMAKMEKADETISG